MSYRDWHVGMKVVCVDAVSHDRPDQPLPLKEGAVYTIAEIRPAEGIYRGGRNHICIELAELRNPYGWGFAVPRFRPVQPRKTDISIFTAMLTGKKEPVRA